MMQLLAQSEIKKEKLIERTKANMTTYVRQSEDKHNLSSRNANKKNYLFSKEEHNNNAVDIKCQSKAAIIFVR